MRIRARHLMLGAAVLVAALVLALAWLAHSESALRWGLNRAAAATEGRLSIDGISGRLVDGARVARLRWRDGQTEIEVLGAGLSWRALDLLAGRLSLASVQANSIDLRLPPAAPGEQGPTAMPGGFGLPWPVLVGSIDVGRIRFRQGDAPALEFSGLHARADFEFGVYRVLDLRLDTPWGELSSDSARIGAAAPHAIDASLRLISDPPRLGIVGLAPDAPSVSLDAVLAGDLNALRLALEASAGDARANLKARVAPLRGLQGIGAASVLFAHVDPSRWLGGAPRAELQGRVELAGSRPWQGTVTLENLAPGALADRRLALRSANARIALADGLIRADAIELAMADGGKISGELQLDPTARLRIAGQALPGLSGRLDVAGFDPAPWIAGIRAVRIDGRIMLAERILEANLREAPREGVSPLSGRQPLAIDARLALGAERIDIETGSIGHGSSRITATGNLRLAPVLRLELAGQAEGFDPSQWFETEDPVLARLTHGTINAQWRVAGAPGAGPWQLALDLRDSRLGNAALSGRASASIEGVRIGMLDADIRLGANRLRADGALGRAEDRLHWRIDLAEPALFDPRLAGHLSGGGDFGWFDGRFALDAGLQARKLAWDGKLSIAQADIRLSVPMAPDQALSARIALDGLVQAGNRLDHLKLDVAGSPQSHRFELGLDAMRQRVRLAGDGHFDAATTLWSATLASGSIDGDGRAGLAAGAQLRVSPTLLQASQWRLTLEGRSGAAGLIALDALRLPFTADASEPIRSSGRIERLEFAPVLAWLDRARERPPAQAEITEAIAGLHLNADWHLDMHSAQLIDGEVNLKLLEDPQAGAGRMLSLGEHTGARLRLNAGRLDGQVDLGLPSLVFSRRYLGDDWRVDGEVTLQAAISGTLAAPKLRGTVNGANLLLEQRSRGWRVDRGELRASFDDESLRIDTLRLASGSDGSVSLSGQVKVLPDAQRDRGNGSRAPGLPLTGELRLDVSRFRVPLDPGQRLLLSGSTDLVSDGREMMWRGKLIADEGLIELRSGGAPVLPDDIRIISPQADVLALAAAEPEAGKGLRVGAELDIDLGRKIRISGGGVEARLEGAVQLKGWLPDSPRVVGSVRVVDGTFEAYGQKLEIANGAIRFNGPIDNPALDITALRRGLPVEAGAHLTGTALSPRIELVSTPNVPDSEKLSWLVLGVPLEDAGAGAQSLALRQAASTLFGGDGGAMSGGLQQQLGIDVLAIGAGQSTGQGEVVGARLGQTGLPGGGDSQSSAALREVVTVGKRLSSRLFVSYEQGLRGAWNLLRIQYDISKRLSLRLQTGSESAIDLLLFHWFD